ncbi:MAG: hypothetical protein ACK4SF_18820 [Algoriphagus aquaeductus]|uniref:hypothetical protein n=1 Tax=Algoriphagus aquaeductus TaxID=475299 RepID=UPI00391AFBB9
MPRYSNLPTLFDNALQIHISKLKEWGYLYPNQWKTSTLNWSRNGEKTGSISIGVSTLEGNEYLHLKYNFRDEPREYKILLVRKPTNLGIGEMWFFCCPSTGKLCRKLYSIDGYFLHREAFKGCFYEKQIQSKYARFLDSNFGAYFKAESLYSEARKKHLKKTYAGKPTKKYQKLSKEIQKAESIDFRDIERHLVFGK